MITLILLIFIIGYIAIAAEHPFRINKTASALITGILCWAVYIWYQDEPKPVVMQLSHHLGDISEILFFLLGAMTIVELIDAHDGFRVITKRIRTTDPVKILWIISWLSFFLAAVLDNLAASIVVVTLTRKLVKDHNLRKYYAAMIILAANAGGLWSPIGSITTTMLWIGERVSAGATVSRLFLPGIINLLVPLCIMQIIIKKKLRTHAHSTHAYTDDDVKEHGGPLMFFVGIGALLFVPVFKTITHLPPYTGMLLSLGIVWLVSELIHRDKDEATRKPYTVSYALSKIDATSVLFFLGILIAIAALESTGILKQTSQWLDVHVRNQDMIALLIGLSSAIVDNVPLVAASMGMYDIVQYPMDHKLWEFLAYTAGTGGSILIIGSAAGVAVMGMEKIDFLWFAKKISLLALAGYLAGAAVYLAFFLLH